MTAANMVKNGRGIHYGCQRALSSLVTYNMSNRIRLVRMTSIMSLISMWCISLTLQNKTYFWYRFELSEYFLVMWLFVRLWLHGLDVASGN